MRFQKSYECIFYKLKVLIKNPFKKPFVKTVTKVLKIMAKAAAGKSVSYNPGPPKKTLQGDGDGTKYSATSRNKARKKYRGQGKG
jgi:hypothetical protein